MSDSGSDSVSVDLETIFLAGKEHIINTASGSLSVIVYGDQDKPPLLTYPDVALNHTSCFQRLLFCPQAASLLLHHFCVYHITPPGHQVSQLPHYGLLLSTPITYIILSLSTPRELLQLGAAPISPHHPIPSVDHLTDQILEVLNYFRLGAVMCMGVIAGAYILTLFAIKHRERVLGLILVSPLCRAPSWSEWFYNKVMSNLLYYYGMCGVLKDFLLHRYFSKEVRGSADVPESDVVEACRMLLDERQSMNVWRFLQAIVRRSDITDGLKTLKCRTLIFVGDDSPFYSDALYMIAKLDRRFSALVEVQSCGSMVTEEQPHAMLIPMEYFLMGYGLHRPKQQSCSPRSPLNPSCIAPELLSPESMGLKLKPIKTRIASNVQSLPL